MGMTHDYSSGQLCYSYWQIIYYEPVNLRYLRSQYAFPIQPLFKQKPLQKSTRTKGRKALEGIKLEGKLFYIPLILCISTYTPNTTSSLELFNALFNLLTIHMRVSPGLSPLYSFTELIGNLIFTLSIQMPLPLTSLALNVHGINVWIKQPSLEHMLGGDDISAGVIIYIYIYIIDTGKFNIKNNACNTVDGSTTGT